MAFPRLSRRWLLAGLLLIAAAAGLLLFLGVANPRITLENYRLIESGMSRAEVVAILGSEGMREEPPWHEWIRIATRQPPEWTMLAHQQSSRKGVESRIWSSVNAYIQVRFDEKDRVCGSMMLVRFDPTK